MAGNATAEFRLLGPLEAYAGGERKPLGGPKERALLARLLVEANRAVPLDRLVEDVWGPGGGGNAERSVRVYVSTLRRRVGDVFRAEAGGYAIRVDDAAIDACRFERLVEQGRRAAAASDHGAARERLAEALGLWRGPALADVRYADWAQPEIARLEELRAAALEERIDADLALGAAESLLPELERLVAEQPLRERPRRQLMLALYRSGRQAEALDVYRDARRMLRDELGLEPTPELAELERAILRHEPHLSVEPEHVRRRRRLPAPLTPLIGRRAEVEAVKALLGGPARLVTLVGPGGTGKTRVALQAAHELAAELPDGAVFVDLAPVRDPALVPEALARALGLHEEPERPARELLVEHVRQRSLLLVADNFEHVEEAAPLLAELLAAGDGMVALATSRSPLRVYGEHRYDVAPLELDREAVPLFVARAQAAAPGFRSSAAVRDVCARLDRLPLAIELAAARAGELTPAEMLASLSRLDLAASGPRDRTPRQQTLRGAIAWSVGLLEPRLRAVFARLAVFAGGWDERAAAAVAGASAEDLRELRRRNLVLGDTGRGAMLATIREYAAELLDELGDAEDARRTHTVHFLALAEEADAALNEGVDQAAWLDRIEADHGNVRAAHDRALETRDARLALRIAIGLGRFWEWRGHVREGARRLEAALALGGEGELRARALLRASVLAHLRGDLEAAGRLGHELLAEARTLGDERLVASALRKLATIAKDAGERERAAALHTDALAVSRAAGDRHGVSSSLMNLADLALALGEHERAAGLARDAVELARDLGDPMRELVSLLNLGLGELRADRGAAAASAFASALELSVELRYPLGLALVFEGLAALEARAARDADAARLVGAAERILGESGDVLEAVEQALHDETVARARDRIGPARLTRALGEGRALPEQRAVRLARRAVERARRGAPAVPDSRAAAS